MLLFVCERERESVCERIFRCGKEEEAHDQVTIMRQYCCCCYPDQLSVQEQLWGLLIEQGHIIGTEKGTWRGGGNTRFL